MAFRHVLLVSATLLVPPAVFPSTLLGQEITATQVENSKQTYTGVINANGVFVHSSAGKNYYATSKLDKGTQVTVVGIKFDWLKIVPPEGSFSYVAQAYVERTGDGKRGKVTRPDLNVRAGSTLNDMKAIVQTKLEQGAEVEILGEKEEYFMIKPPPGCYLYVNKEFVDPVAPVTPAVAQNDAPAAPAEPQVQAPDAPPSAPDAPPSAPPAEGMPQQPAQVAEGATTEPAAAPDAVAQASTATTQPTSADAQFDQLETQFAEASNKPIDQQPINELKASYEALIKDPQLPESLRRVADYRVKTLQVRGEALQQFIELKKSQEASAKRRQALQAEQEELAEQIKKNQVKMYAAVGTLYTSSYQQGKQTLYRLTDPATGRTVVYIRTDDPTKYGGLLGQFIGVKGEVTTDPQLSMKVVAPTDAEAVDQNALYKSVVAQVVPPSMLPKGTDATASTEEGGQ